jgi:peptidoglycan DL-endopeptidase CwlO
VLAGRALVRSLFVGVAAAVLVAPASLAQADPSPAELQAQIDKGNAKLELVVEQYNKVNGDLAATQASLSALEAKLPPLKADMDKAYADVDQMAVSAYKSNGGLREMSVLLSASSSGTFVDQYATLQQVAKSRRHDIANFTTVKRQYDAEKARLDQLLATQNAQKIDLATKRAKIEGDIARLDAMQRKVDADIAKAKAAADAAARANAAKAKASGTAKPNSPAPPKNPTKAQPKPPKPSPPPKVSGKAGKAVAYAWAQIGKRYVFGTAGPNTFDCSGLTMMAWKAAGVALPHNAAQQWGKVRHISRSQLVPGDLVFYNGLGHVGIFIGNNQIIHAPNSRTVVKVAPIGTDAIYGFGRP